MPVRANIEIIWVIIVIISVIAQVIKGARKVASQAPGTNNGADETLPGGKGVNAQKREFIAPDEALQDFLRTLGGGQKPAAKPTAPSPVQAKSPTRGISRQQVKPGRQAYQPVSNQTIPAMPRHKPADAAPAYVQSVQDSVVLEKTSSGRQTAAGILGLAIRKDLSDAESIRKAIVLREVLGPPIALR
jgi:hypothetical protein